MTDQDPIAITITNIAGPFEEYPQISDSELERLEWNIVGDFSFEVGGVSILNSPYAADGKLNDYVWVLAHSFLNAIQQISDGNEAKVSLNDNPGVFRFQTVGDELEVTFDPQVSDRSPVVKTVLVSDFYSASLEAAHNLCVGVIDANPALEDSELVNRLQSKIKQIEK